MRAGTRVLLLIFLAALVVVGAVATLYGAFELLRWTVTRLGP
jgi:hypothetical protein